MSGEAELVELLVPRLRRMLRAGTTTVECKASEEYPLVLTKLLLCQELKGVIV